MNTRAYNQLKAERAAVDQMLSRLPLESVIERKSLESRKRDLEQTLALVEQPDRLPAQVRLTFRGTPIAGTHGIRADFGALAIKAFTNAVAITGASQDTPLASRGSIRNRDDYGLQITDTALGSFGFEMEEIPRTGALLDDSRVESAIARTKAILEATVETDEVFDECCLRFSPTCT